MDLALLQYLGHGWCFVAAGLIYHAITLIAVAWRRRADRRAIAAIAAARLEPCGVTVLKPLCGCDEQLEQNLESFVRQTWQPLQLVLGAVDAHDPALVVARRVQAHFPDVDISVICEPASDYSNPKVQALEMLARHAKYDFLLISDSNVRARPGDLHYLMATAADPNVGLVYQRVVGEGEQSVCAALENLKLTDYCGAGMTALRQLMGCDAVMGKGMLVRREALDSIGSWPLVADVAAEDYVLGQSLDKAGWLVEMAPVEAHAIHVRWSWAGFWNRTVRHAALRFCLSPWTFPGELLLINPVFLTFVTWCVVGFEAFPAFVVSCVARIVSDTIEMRLLRGRAMAPWFMALAPLKDLLLALAWFRALFVKQIGWRGTAMKLGWGTRLAPTETSYAHEFDHVPLSGTRSMRRGANSDAHRATTIANR